MRYDISTKVRLLSKLNRGDELLVHKEMQRLDKQGTGELPQSGGKNEEGHKRACIRQ